jgi:WD40 repeat protein/energy-coupling factor transporter ATP-binding protein EcfA2
VPQNLDDQTVLAPRWPASPFPGLRPFRITATEDESLIFYGRNRAKDEILSRLNSSHLVFVVGPSGCGKSSLLKVGVIPALEAGLLTHAGANWRTAEMRPGNHPVRNLAYALAALQTDAGKGNVSDQIYDLLCLDESGLWLAAETLAPRATPNPLLILIDQFEEVFSQISAQSERTLLLELIVAFWAKAHPNLFLVVTMRTDFLEQCANFPKLADAINATLFMTPVLRDSEIKSVVSLPPEPYHGIVEPKLVEAIVKDTSSELGYNPDHLPLMQHALSWLWNKAISYAGLFNSPPRPDAIAPSPRITLTYDHYVTHGGLKGILNEHADELLAGLSKREQSIAQVVFTRLSERDESRYRRSPTSAAALATLANCRTAELERVVSVFANPSVCFLDRRPLPNEAGELVDLSHESLIRQWDRLRRWADEEAEKVRSFRALAASAGEWQRHERSTDFLKRGAELGVWRQWWKSQNPSGAWAARYKLDGAEGSLAPLDLSKEYLAQSYKRYMRQQVTNWVVGLAVAAVFGAIAAAIPIINIKWEKTALEKARYETAAARGNDLLDNDDPHLALLLALEFLRPKGQTEVNGWANKALEFLLPKKVYNSLLPKEADDRSIEALAYKALQTPQPKAILLAEAPFPTATFSPDGGLLLMSKGNAFQLWDTDKISPVGKEFNPKGINARWRTIWSPDAQWMIGSNANKETRLFRPCSVDKLREYFQRCENDVDVIRTIGEGDNTASWPSVLSPAGDKLLSGGMGVSPKIWDIEANRFTLLSRPDPDPQGPVGLAIAFNERGDLFALGSVDGSVRIHQTADPTKRSRILRIRPGDEVSTVNAIAFNPGKGKDDELVSATLDGCVRLWSLTEEKVMKALNIGNGGFFFVSFDPSGQRVAMTSDDGVVKIWELGVSEPRSNEPSAGCASNSVQPGPLVLRGHRHATWVAEFSRETNLLASASSDSVRIWALEPPLHPSMLPAPPERLGEVTIVSQSGALTLRTGNGRDITLEDPYSGNNAAAAAVSMDGKRVLVAEQKETLKLYDLSASRVPAAKFAIPGVEWKSVGFVDPDGMVGEATTGKFYAWPVFKDRDALINFAAKHLPLNEKGETIRLSQKEKCRFGVVTTQCSP